MRDIRELFSHVAPFAATCPEPTLEHHIRSAAIKFCQRTRAWRIQDVLTLDAEFVVIPTPQDSILYEVESVKYRETADNAWSNPLQAISLFDLADMSGDGQPAYYYQSNRFELSVFPHQTGLLQVSLYLRPDEKAETLPDFLCEEFADVIAAGALSTILLLTGFEFTNPKLAMYYENKFKDGLDANFDANLRGQQRAPVRTKPSFF